MSDRKYAYHVTRKIFLPSISKKGLIPHIPEDADWDDNAIFLFATEDDLDNGLINWFGDRINNWEEEHDQPYQEIALKVDITDLPFCKPTFTDDSSWEITCTERIPPDRIVGIRDYESDDLSFLPLITNNPSKKSKKQGVI